MNTKGEFYSAKMSEEYPVGSGKLKYPIEIKSKIEEAGAYCIESLDDKSYSPIMMLGRIQSGKTRTYIGLVSLLLDNEFDFILVLSKNSKPLVQQTLKRLQKEFLDFVKSKKLIIKDIFEINTTQKLPLFEKKLKRIVICKKQKDNLKRIEEYINTNHFETDKKILVIDDEADITSIGYVKNKESDDDSFFMQKIADQINKIRGSFINSVFLQVTATPYALYLQPKFDNADVLDLRPDKTVVIPSGEGYFGGRKLICDEAATYYEEIPKDELEFITTNVLDERSIIKDKLIGIIGTKNSKIDKLVQSIFTFIVGGCVIKLKNESNNQGFLSFVIHTNTRKDKHTNAEQIVNLLLEQLDVAHRNEQRQEIKARIKESYNLLKINFQEMPELELLEKEFFNDIDEGTIKTIVVNSDNDIETILNDDGEIDLVTPYTIIIGGQSLDRGVTISNMIGFYYGRDPKTTQQDTVMQHMRIFGYRQENQLKVTKFYTSRLIFERLSKIVAIDEELRESIDEGEQREGLYLLNRDETGRIKPCSRNKIATSNIIYIKGKKRFLPIGFHTTPKSCCNQHLVNIMRIFNNHIFENDCTYISLEETKVLLKEVYSILEKDAESDRFIDFETLIDILNSLEIPKYYNNKICLIKKMDRELKKFKRNNAFQDAPDTPNESTLAYIRAEKSPVLMLLEQTGLKENGWNGSRFWWPVFVTPIRSKNTIMALDWPKAKVEKR